MNHLIQCPTCGKWRLENGTPNCEPFLRPVFDVNGSSSGLFRRIPKNFVSCDDVQWHYPELWIVDYGPAPEPEPTVIHFRPHVDGIRDMLRNFRDEQQA